MDKSLNRPGNLFDAVLLVMCAVAFTAWLSVAGHQFSPRIMAVSLSFLAALYVSGRLVLDLVRIAPIGTCFISALVFGFVYLNTMAFMLFLVLPVRVSVTYLLAFLLLLPLYWLVRRRRKPQSALPGVPVAEPTRWLELAVVAFILIAVTFWSQKSINPVFVMPDAVVYKPWADGFAHATMVWQLAGSNGIGGIQNITMGGQPAILYHYAFYFSSALIKNLAGIDAYVAYEAFLVPFGLLMAGLAGFVLIKALFGKSTAFFCVTLLLVLPAPAHMGVNNNWFNYHWLLQSSSGLSYGLVIVALCWLFMLLGCRERKWTHIAIAYVLALVCVVYRAHFLVANAFLVMVFPAFFMKDMRLAARAVWFTVMATVYTATVVFSWSITAVPLIKFDGSAFFDYSAVSLIFSDPSPFKDFFTQNIQTGHAKLDVLLKICLMVLMFFVSGFGVMGVIALAGLLARRSGVTFMYRFLPTMFMANYLVMTTTLAYNFRTGGTREEFLHRPLAMAYFFMMLFGGAMLWAAIRIVHSRVFPAVNVRAARRVACAAAFCLLAVPLVLGRATNMGPPFGVEFNNVAIPQGLYDSARFVKANSRPADLMQYSRSDRFSFLSAVTERLYFVNVNNFVAEEKGELARRSQLVRQLFDAKSSASQVAEALASSKISWLIVDPRDSQAWATVAGRAAVFESRGYQVYKVD